MDGVDELLTLLSLLKSDGWNAAFTEDAVYRSHGLRCRNPHSYAEPLLSLRQSLEESKSCIKVLDRIRHHLGKRIRSLRRHCTPLLLEDGVRRMPDELSAHIFEMGHASEESETSQFSLTVSHVSHRFRQVALRKPVLWSRLSIADPLDQIETFIPRSGLAGLEVDVTPCWYNVNESRLAAFFEAVGHLARRWLSITGAEGVLVPMIASAGSSEFPNLLHLAHFDCEIMTLWKMPLLTSIQKYDGVLTPFKLTPEMPHLSQLTSIELCFTEEFLDVFGLLEAIRAIKSMRDLSLELDGCRGQSDPTSRR
ncbi:hypothetical protein BD410DRAFT_297870 [Rickenella mellea]|uniref:Uncharacterized protein n=1 Tax=Rickenella mellea TaxID=50990 RepID=A0A4Y7PG26_9AGAM|nr:hypothetical protein BD410DRAFT_297870 [Rickenella mellea]